jgi:hypothetical protein
MKPTLRGQGLSIELAITIFGVMTAYWIGQSHKGSYIVKMLTLLPVRLRHVTR